MHHTLRYVAVLFLAATSFAQCPQPVKDAFPQERQQVIVCQLWTDNETLKNNVKELIAKSPLAVLYTLPKAVQGNIYKPHPLANIFAVAIQGNVFVPLPGTVAGQSSVTLQSAPGASCQVTLTRRPGNPSNNYDLSTNCPMDIRWLSFTAKIR